MSTATAANRMLALDYLRGFFIVVIVIDHLWRWPSLLVIFSGKGELWVTAAEGFVIISGLLIGYVRGYKNRSLPMKTVTGKLLRRSLLLYIWFVLMTLIYTAIVWYAPTIGSMPWVEVGRGDWIKLITQTMTLQFAHEWVHFLYLYAIFLALAPIVVWLLRKKLAWLVAILSTGIFLLGYVWRVEWMLWQILFFLPSIAGFYLTTIQKWWRQLTTTQRRILLGCLWTAFVAAVAISLIYSPLLTDSDSADALNSFFSKDTMTFGHVLMAFLWFTGLAMFFEYSIQFIKRWLGWLFEPFGTRSLTAYIVHGMSIVFFALIAADSQSIIINTFIGIVCILMTWAIVRLPLVQKYIPR